MLSAAARVCYVGILDSSDVPLYLGCAGADIGAELACRCNRLVFSAVDLFNHKGGCLFGSADGNVVLSLVSGAQTLPYSYLGLLGTFEDLFV